MKNLKDNDHASRRSTAADAKAAQLKAHRDAIAAAEPTRLARQQERMALAEAKAERLAERARVKQEEQARLEAAAALEQEQAAAQAEADAKAREEAKKDGISRAIKDEAALKAERDRRYANRKSRQR
ncbi:MAG: DUF6481 family protein [Rhodobacterales bacterium]